MDKKLKIYLICAITSFSILFFLFLLGIIEGISIKGRIVERTLLLIFICATILGIRRSIIKKNKKTRRIFLWTFLSPFFFTMICMFFNPLLTLHLTFMVVVNTLSNETTVYQSENIKIVKGFSMMTNDLYDIKTDHMVYEKLEGHFFTSKSLKKSTITYNKKYIIIENKESIDTFKIIK